MLVFVLKNRLQTILLLRFLEPTRAVFPAGVIGVEAPFSISNSTSGSRYVEAADTVEELRAVLNIPDVKVLVPWRLIDLFKGFTVTVPLQVETRGWSLLADLGFSDW